MSKELLQQVLDALIECNYSDVGSYASDLSRKSIASLRAAIAQPDVQPVAEIAALRKDAERYRWLKTNGLFAQPQGYDTQLGLSDLTGEEPLKAVFVNGIVTHSLCDAIDAAMTGETK